MRIHFSYLTIQGVVAELWLDPQTGFYLFKNTFLVKKMTGDEIETVVSNRGKFMLFGIKMITMVLLTVVLWKTASSGSRNWEFCSRFC